MTASSLPERRVDLWHVWADAVADDGLLRQCRMLLDAEELAQEGRLRMPRDRRRFLVRRALARSVLSHYTGVGPKAWRFTRNCHGKPAIAGPIRPPLHFNLSHSSGMIVMAVARDRPVGVDIEEMRSGVSNFQVARRYFAREEIEFLERVPEADRSEAFYQLWTLKESFLKARGVGLSSGLRHFGFRIRADKPPAVFFRGCNFDDDEAWQFRLLRLSTGAWRATKALPSGPRASAEGIRFQVALAVRQPAAMPWTLRLRAIDPSVGLGGELPSPDALGR